MANWALEGVVFACLLAAAATDIMGRIVPNRLVLAVMVAGVALRLLPGVHGFWLSVVIWAVSLGFLGILAARNVLGWGDVKLIAAVTVLVPPREVAPLLIAIALAGGVLACLYLVARRALRARQRASPGPADPACSTVLTLLRRERTRIQANEPMPYAVAVLGGVTYQTAIEMIRCWHVISC